MKENDNKRSLFSKKDIVIIVLCVLALMVLLFLLKISKETEKNEQQQLNSIQEQMRENGNAIYTANEDASASVVINEVNAQGWIELYNNKKEDIQLDGYCIYINGEEVKTFEKEQSISVGKLLVVETGVSLADKEKNLVTICDKDENCINSVIVPMLKEHESYGRVENGSIQFTYQSETREQNNNSDNNIKKDELSFSIPGGFYQNSISVEINIPEGMEVYYTLDGTEPTLDSQRYSSPIQIHNRTGSAYQYAAEEMTNYLPEGIYMGTVVRAVAVDRSKKVKQTETQSYFIGITNNTDIYDVPVLSITTNPENLFDYFEGIYVPGRSKEDAIAMDISTDNVGNYWNDWVKDAHIEYFEATKNKTYEANISLSMLKDYSVETHQKGFRVSDITESDLKGTGLQNSYNEIGKCINILTNKRDNIIKLRETLANEMLKDTAVGTVSMKPCVVFIDGEYWGVYMLREEIDASYIRSAYEIDNNIEVLIEKNDLFNDWDHHRLYDDFYHFIRTTDMSVSANYEKAKELMDVQSYLDYLCANVYLANADYGIEESCMWRTTLKGEGYADGKWRWIVGKLDNAMNNEIESKRTSSTIDTYKMPELARDEILMSLIKNEEFREELQKNMNKMAEEIFAEEKVSVAMNEISERTQKMALTSYKRFFGNATEKTYNNEIEKVTEFFANRAEYILIYTDEVIDMNGKWYITESVNEERRVNEQEVNAEPVEQNTTTARDNVLPQ